MAALFIKLTFSVIGATALVATVALSFPCPSNANEEADCPGPLEGVGLSDRQLARLWQLEEELDQKIEDIMPLSEEQETAIEALEEDFEAKVAALLSKQQKQQIETLDQWTDEQLMGIVPEWFDEIAEADGNRETEVPEQEDPPLSPDQVRKLEELEEKYDQRFEPLLNTDQLAQIAQLEEELDEAIASVLPGPSISQEEEIEAVEIALEEQVNALLTAEQRQQVEENLACEWSDDL